MVKRFAFTLIELIFAIVIIGITVAAVPQMMFSNSRSVERGLMREAVFLASAEANRMLAFQWDTASVDASLTYARILDTGLSSSTNRVCFNPQDHDVDAGMALPCSTAPYLTGVFPSGGIPYDKHRRFYNTVTVPADNGLIGGQADVVKPLDLINTHGYKKSYSIGIQSGYANQPFGSAFSGAASDVKMVQITVTDTTVAGGDSVVLRTYAYNIGEIGYAKRPMQ